MPLPLTVGTGRALLGRSRAFRPSDISGLELWLGARFVTGKNDGDAVSSWLDQSSNGRNAGQANGTKQPLYKTGIINGLPVLRFDGSDDFLNVPAIDLTGTSGLTLFVVVANITSGGDRIIFENSTNINSFTDGFLLYRETGNSIAAALRGSAGGAGSNFVTTASVTSAATVISAVYDKALATNEVTAWLNGTSAGTRPQNLNNTGTFGNRASFIGMRAGTTLPLAGDIAELILYNRALSATERQQVESYLA